MQKTSNEGLVKILTVEREKYKPNALEAAQFEFKKRQLNLEDFKTKIESNQSKAVTDNLSVPSTTRFKTFLADTVIWLTLYIFLGGVLSLLLEGVNELLQSLITLLGFFGSYIAYYFVMENSRQKTLGKFMTKTKVVMEDGSKPRPIDIFIRSLCRFITFDHLSFLFTKNGFHDRLSKTKVIKDLPKN